MLREIRRSLPAEDLVYVADSGYAPYGDHSLAYVQERAEEMTRFLLGRGAKAVVIACNTASGSAVDALRAQHRVPIVAMEPAVKPAVARTRSGVVGVLATSRTLSTPKFARLVAAHAGSVRLVPQACPGLAERVEAGDVGSAETRALVRRYVEPLVRAGADTMVIGCTHYAFLEAVIQEVAGPGVELIDSAVPVARQLERRLAELGLRAPEGGRQGSEEFWTTGDPAEVRPTLDRLWGPGATLRRVPARAVGGLEPEM